MPDVKEVTIPEAPPTDATSELELVQDPPAIELLSVIDDPAHIIPPPAIGDGVMLTVITLYESPQLPEE